MLHYNYWEHTLLSSVDHLHVHVHVHLYVHQNVQVKICTGTLLPHWSVSRISKPRINTYTSLSSH